MAAIGAANSQLSFEQAYSETQYLPHGILEAVSWTNTHMQDVTDYQESCSGIPKAYGVMGLHDDGKDYFIKTGEVVANLSGISIEDQKSNIELQILAYAKALDAVMESQGATPQNFNNPSLLKNALNELSEIPSISAINDLARDMQVYDVLQFMNKQEMAVKYNFPVQHYSLTNVFSDNYPVLSSSQIKFTPTAILGDNGSQYILSAEKSADYGPAIWNPADPCNYSSRSGTPVSAITIHTIQGTYAGAISWAQNCASSVSYHYVVRSSDGQVTQMVLESDKAWHVGSENPYTIGYEHDGYVDDPSWYTEALYNASAGISRDIIQSGYGINGLRTYFGPSSASGDVLGSCIRIKGHQHYPNQTHTDPGINWDWEKYYKLINNDYTPTLYTGTSGTLYDSGGAIDDYTDDERLLWLIEPANTQNITLDFVSFGIELDWDYLYIYDGDSVTAPLIGVYTGTTSPGTIVSSGGALLLEFRSDCATTLNGWEATYTSTPLDIDAPSTAIIAGPNWHTDDFSVSFNDADALSGVNQRFYLASENNLTPDDWYGTGSLGFVHETFNNNSSNWFNVVGTYQNLGQQFVFSDVSEGNSNAYLMVDQSLADEYLYEWDQNIISSGANQRAGMHFACDNPNLPNRGNSYFVYLRETDNKLQLYSVSNDTYTLEVDQDFTVNSNTVYNIKTTYNRITGDINVYIDDAHQISWTSSNPVQNGNSISLRTGECSVEFDNIKVYQSRSSSVNITAGLSDFFNVESLSATPTGRIISIVTDNVNNISSAVTEDYLLDFSSPELDHLNDGSGNDIDTVLTALLEGNWLGIDVHSDIQKYTYAIGTLPNLDDVVTWTDNGATASLSELIPSPIYGQMYHISLKVTNNAGLESIYVSDGQRYLEGLGITESELESINVVPNPASNNISITGTSISPSQIVIYNNLGEVVYSGNEVSNINVSSFANGSYHVYVRYGTQVIVKQFIKQ